MGNLWRHLKLTTWYNQLVTDPDLHLPLPEQKSYPSSHLKHWLDRQGLAQTGWLFYFLHGDAVLDGLGTTWFHDDHPAESVRNAITFLNLIAGCEMGPHFLPPLALVRSMSQWGIPEQQLALIHPNFFRTLWGACTLAEYHLPNSQHAIEKFVNKAVLPVVHWYFTTDQYLNEKLSHYLKTAGWVGLSGSYSSWHGERKRKAEDQCPPPAEWPVLIEKYATEDLIFVPLASRKALEIEGRRMRNCIAKYAPRCQSGEVQAFSVRYRETGVRLATMTIQKDDTGRWVFDEAYGSGNFCIPSWMASSVEQFLGANGIVLNDEQRGKLRIW